MPTTFHVAAGARAHGLPAVGRTARLQEPGADFTRGLVVQQDVREAVAIEVTDPDDLPCRGRCHAHGLPAVRRTALQQPSTHFAAGLVVQQHVRDAIAIKIFRHAGWRSR